MLKRKILIVMMQKFSNRSDFGYVSKHFSNQFYGFLYTDKNIESYIEMFPK